MKTESVTTILCKGDLYSLLSIFSGPLPDEDGQITNVNAVAKLDPREDVPLIKPFTERREAITQYKQAIETSLARGWQVAWQGSPLAG